MNEGFFALAAIAWLAYLASRLFRQQVPELVAFLFVGALAGPSVTGLLSDEELVRLQPVVEGALAVLMFIIGERVSVRALRRARWIVTSGALQYALTGTVLYFVSLELGAGRPTALMLATIAGAGAPMTVASLVGSTRARGQYADGLIGTHALSDALAATFFAAVLPIAEFIAGPGSDIGNAATRFLKLGVGGVVLGLVLGWIIARLGQQIETSGELLLFVLVHLLVAVTAASALELSLPLAAVIMGAATGTVAPTDHAQRVFVVTRTIEQPLYLLFFALAGASIHIEEIPEIGMIGAGYVVVRLAGKLIGGLVGGVIGGLAWRQATRLGFDLIPQAGVAVGLAVLAADTLPGSGNRVATIVLGSVVIFELAGSLIVTRSLRSTAAATSGNGAPKVHTGDVPRRVLIASRGQVLVPPWVLEAASRWGAEVVMLGRGKDGDPHVDELRDLASESSVPFRWIPLKAESFTGTVVRTARGVEADLVIVLVPPFQLGFESRLVLLPHERIARELSVPVLFLPLEAAPATSVSKPAGARLEDQPPRQPTTGETPAVDKAPDGEASDQPSEQSAPGRS